MSKFFTNLSVNPKDVQTLKELIPYSIDKDEEFQEYITLRKVKDGDPIGFFGDADEVGISGSGCDPTYQEIGIANSQKRWTLGDWQIPLKICYESLEGTIAEYTLKTGTDIGDLTTGEFMQYILRPALEKQMKRMMWRFGWFGDTGAKTVANGGQLTNGSKTDLFTTCDGLFKRIFTQCTANNKQRTQIAANNERTYAAQKAAMLVKGAATGIMDNVLMDADSRIISDGEAVIYMTDLFGKCLTRDVKERWNINMPWEKIFDGVEVAKYDTVKVVRISIWDRMISAYEKVQTGENDSKVDNVNKPFRLVFGNKRQFMVGTPADGLISDLDIWFDKKERRNYIYSTGKIGTSLLEDDMFHAAY